VKSLRVIAIATILTLLSTNAAQALTRKTPPFLGGFYAEAVAAHVAQLDLFVSGNGKKVIGGGITSGGDCVASQALVNEGVPAGGSVEFGFPESFPIAANGAFHFAGTITLQPSQTNGPNAVSGYVSLSGHFVKGKIVARKTNAVIGTFSAPSICAANTPTRVVMQWDVTDN
jgi:hypothetical protein